MSAPNQTRPSRPVRRRLRLTAAAVATGIAGSLTIALSMGASLSGLSTTINNSLNTATSATLAIQETGTSGASGTCNSYDGTATCSSINKYGGATLIPGGTTTQVVQFQNMGSAAVGSATLTPTACSASAGTATGSTTPTTPNTTSGNLCSVLTVAVYKGATATGTAIYSGALSGIGTAARDLATTLTANTSSTATSNGGTQSFTFVITLPSTATTAVQGQVVTQPLLWTFTQ